MFTSLESFSAFFFVSFAIILLGILFEEKLVAMEARMYKKSQIKNRAKNQTSHSKHHNNCKTAPHSRSNVHRTRGTGFAA